jgi:hypothetical protein
MSACVYNVFQKKKEQKSVIHHPGNGLDGKQEGKRWNWAITDTVTRLNR